MPPTVSANVNLYSDYVSVDDAMISSTVLLGDEIVAKSADVFTIDDEV